MAASLLPSQIPPQAATFCAPGPDGRFVVDVDWWLFFYNIAIQVLGAQPGAAVLPASVLIAMTDQDADSADEIQDARRIANATLLIPDPDIGPSLRDLANALILATDGLLQDPNPQAQPVAVVSVGGSPFTYTAPANGTLWIVGGTVASLALVRGAATVSLGIIAGPVSVSRADQVVITHTGAPNATFVPT